jgi:TonB family protein
MVSLSKPDWQFRPAEKIRVEILVRDKRAVPKGKEDQVAVSPTRFLSDLNPTAASDLAATEEVIVRREGVATIFKLSGLADALAKGRECLAQLKPKVTPPPPPPVIRPGPPAPPAPPPPPRMGPARPRMIAGSIGQEDYPVAALKVGAQGTTAVELKIDKWGLVEECKISQSSGNADLDFTTCRLAQLRFRYSPALNERGKPVRATISTRLRWALTPDAPAETTPDRAN